jgi:hypothetical protein
MTLSLEGAEPSLLDPQEPLSLDRPSGIGAPHELLYASDFVPKKARVDVLLAGHARSSTPSRRIPVRFCAGDLERCFFALAAEPSEEIPLSATYLRAGEAPASGGVSVGPTDVSSPDRARLLGRASLGPGGVPLAPLPADFDFGAFNAAPPEQQIDELPPGAVIELDALLPGQPHRVLTLPSERPRVYVLAKDAKNAGDASSVKGAKNANTKAPGARGRTLFEVPLRCDTLWIDADRALCSLVWRGVIELAGDGAALPELAVSLAAFGLAERISDLERRLESAPRVRAAEASDFQAQHAVEDEPTASVEAEPAPETPPAQALGSLGAMRLGAARRAHDDDEKTMLHSIPARPAPVAALAPGDDDIAEEIAADELVEEVDEVLEVEEIEPYEEALEEIADEPTSIPEERVSASPAPPGNATVTQPLGVSQDQNKTKTKTKTKNPFGLEESTQTNFKIPERAALPFDRQSPIPAAPEPSRDSRPPYSDLPFQMSPAVAAPAAPEAKPKAPLPDALPFKSQRKMTLINPPLLPEDVPPALPFVKVAGDAVREAAADSPPAMPVLPFVKVVAEAPRDVPPPAGVQPVLPFITTTKTLPGIPSNPDVAPPDTPSALPFSKPAAPPPSDTPSPPAWVPSALPFVKKSEPEATPWAAPSPAFPFLRPLIPVAPATPSPDAAPPEAEPLDPQEEKRKRLQAQIQKPLLPLETYATIQVDLWDEGVLLENVLARHGIDEITWRDNEQRRADALAEESKQGRSEMAVALAEALEAAAARRAPSEDLSLDDYVTVRVMIEDASEPEPVLARRNLSQSQWQRIDRQWRKRAKSDAALAKEIRAKLAELRKAAAAPPPRPAKPTKMGGSARKRAKPPTPPSLSSGANLKHKP